MFLEHSRTFMEGIICEKNYQLKVVKYFCKTASTIDFRLASKYGSSQYCQKNSYLKDISPVI